MRRVLALLLALPLAPTPPADACAPPRLVDVAMTPEGTTIMDGGGVVLQTINGGGDDRSGGGQLLAGGKDVTLRRDYLAPGLNLIVPRPGKNRDLQLGAKPVIRLRQGGVAPKHAAPKLATVTSSLAPTPPSKNPPPMRMYGPSGTFTVDLAEAAPADVLALVVYTTQSTTTGIAWAAPRKGVTSYSFSFGGKNCSPGPGSLEQGTKVTVGWIDVSGRISVLSKEIKVSATPSKP